MGDPGEDIRGPVAFAEKVLALLEQGRFTATYKYAVMLGLMDLCMELADRDGRPRDTVTTRELAEKVIQIYWPHTLPFDPSRAPGILRQNASHSGSQAEILEAIRRFRAHPEVAAAATPHAAALRAPSRYGRLVHTVEWKLIEMPLPRLQTIGSVEDVFIYRIGWDRSIEQRRLLVAEYQRGTDGGFDGRIRFLPGVAGYFVLLNGLLRPLIQARWAAMVAQINGFEEARLGEFLFGASRTSLLPVRGPLSDLQDQRCFYCGDRLAATPPRSPEVDHFIPWARYPDNGIGNLVVAHRQCNGAKKDFLAAAPHVGRWVEHGRCRRADLERIAAEASWPQGRDRTLGVARSIYLNIRPELRLWQEGRTFVPADIGALAEALSRPFRAG